MSKQGERVVKLKKLAQVISLICIAGPTLAQQASAPPQKLEKVEVTGSSIKRVQDETALPIQIITKAEIDRAGIVSAEQLIARISANGTGADNLSSNVGIQLGTTDRNNNGNTSANLRGLGASSTLVLLNGRRVSLHGAKGNAVDLNTIPLAAVERVEILKDGASAIYGTDAIGGVINFILRKDYSGVELTAFTDITEQGGGNIHRASILAGTGDLAKDGFNVMGSITFDRQERLAPHSRDFANGFQPARGLSPDTAGAPFASQTGLAGTAIGSSFTTPNLGTGTQTFNRANLFSFQGKCDSIQYMSQYQFALWASPGARYACAYDYGGAEVLIQPVERTNFVGRATWQFGGNHTAFAEVTASRTKANKEFEENQLTTGSGTLSFASVYPVNGPYYQNLSAFIPTFDPTKPIAYRWRCEICGKRQIETTTDASRVLAGLEGVVFSSWDYKLGLSSAESKANSNLNGGYYYTAPLIAALGSGKVNPWLLPGQSQTTEAIALFAAANATGAKLFGGKATLLQFDGSLSGEIITLPAGPLGAAVGFDVRRESYKFNDGSRSSQPIFNVPFDAEFSKVSRNISAVYAELAVPIVKNLEAQVAVRHDRYSDFGGTTNPKVALKWTASDAILLRGSYNEGFRAPSFFQLYGATGRSQIPGNIADPVLCPQRPTDLSVCAIRPDGLQGGNKNLTPETSKQWSAGFVVAPAAWVNASVDMWEIKRSDRIYELTPQQVVANYLTFPENIVRKADGTIDFIRAGFVNAEGDITRGVDLGLKFSGKLGGGKWDAAVDGTYIESFRSRIFASQAYEELVGRSTAKDGTNLRDLFPRWKHQARFTYSEGNWSGTLSQSFTAGYKDAPPAGTIPPGFNPDVEKYITYDVSATYSGFKNLTITGGIKNLLDKDPSFTAHNLDFAAGAGWEPRVADPRGRAYRLMVNYKF